VKILKALMIILVTLNLTSCMTAATTAVVGGGLLYERKTVEQVVADQHIRSEIINAYFDNGTLWEQNRVIVSCVNGYVLLMGEVGSPQLKQTAITLAQQVGGVVRVYDEIAIGTPVSIFQQMKDAFITIVIKTKMLGAADFSPSNVKVITNNNIVYLMGVVDPKQADRAADIASHTASVQKVVKVFQYIT
jgi:osmotically-inducible protein OsmY